MDLSKDQQSFYQQARERCTQDVAQMNQTIRTEWAHLQSEYRRVVNLVQTLEVRKQTVGQMHASASAMLNQEGELDVTPLDLPALDAEDGDDLGVGEIDL